MREEWTSTYRSESARYSPGTSGLEWVVIAGVVIVSGAVSAVVFVTSGNLVAPAGLLIATALLIVTLYRIEWSLYILVGSVMLFDQYPIPRIASITFSPRYFQNLKEHPYLPSFDVGVANLVELHVLLLILVWLLTIARRKPMFVPVPVWGALLLCYAAIAFSFVWGMRLGGDLLPALWEVRALVYLAFFYVLVPQIVRTKEQIRTLVWIFIGAILFKALQGLARFASFGFSFYGHATLTNHEDPVFITTLVILLLSLVMFEAKDSQRNALLWILLPLFGGFVTAQRRAAYAALAISLVVFVVLLPKEERWKLVRVMFPFALAGAVYCAALWNSDSRLASPVRLVKSGLADEKEEMGDRYYSNLYRKFENYDLAFTHRRAAMLGIGFGKKYDVPIPLSPMPMFPLRPYIGHNQILWFIVKTGAVGFFCLFLFFNSFVFRAAATLYRLKDPYLKAVIAMAVVAVFNQIVVSYYDLQLTYYRNMIYLGCLMGLLAVVEAIERNKHREVAI